MIDKKKCESLGLSYEVIQQHSLLLNKTLTAKAQPEPISVHDTCRVDNYKVLAPLKTKILDKNKKSLSAKIAAFIPAAGASSRYAEPLTQIKKSLAPLNKEVFLSEVNKLNLSAAKKNWVLPSSLISLIKSQSNNLAPNTINSLIKELNSPKALFPCVHEGFSYLQLKCFEHQKIKHIEEQIFICPEGLQKEFQNQIGQATKSISTPMASTLIEQDGSMSTIRFSSDGDPIIDPETSSYSKVPAGHGSLVHTFPKIKKSSPDIDAIFIRNIDNVTGTSQEVLSATNSFLESFDFFIQAIKDIRQSLSDGDMEKASNTSRKLLLNFPELQLNEQQSQNLEDCQTEQEKQIWLPLFLLFHHQIRDRSEQTMKMAKDLYNLPFNLMGVVANNGTDIGGSPVVIRHNDEEIKVCLELPHATPEDQKRYFFNPKVATHFNPVFVTAEVPDSIKNYTNSDNPFWLLAQKKWNGQSVQYFETVLYELLGNSKMANVIFLEVPRCVFNPHKTLDDTSGRKISDWISD